MQRFRNRPADPARRAAMACLCLGGLCGLGRAHAQFPDSKTSQTPLVTNACGANDDNTTNKPPRVASSGSASLDKGIRLEKPMLNDYFHVEPVFYFGDDSAGAVAKAYSDGGSATIVVSPSFVRREIRLNPTYWEIAMIGILAHEWAHALQYSIGMLENRYLWETHADYLAGWYMGSKHSSGMHKLDPGVFATSLFAKGSSEGFYDPAKYGSSSVRVAAMMKGFDFAYQEADERKPHDVMRAAETGYRYVRATRS